MATVGVVKGLIAVLLLIGHDNDGEHNDENVLLTFTCWLVYWLQMDHR